MLWISAQSWKQRHDWDNYRKTGVLSLTNLHIKLPLLQEDEKYIFTGSLMELHVAAQLSCPSCSNSGRNTPSSSGIFGWHWKQVTESKNGHQPTKSYCLPSVTTSPSCFTRGTWQLVVGNVHITEVRVARNHTELWEIPGWEPLKVMRSSWWSKVSISY